MRKLLVPVIYLRDGKAVSGFGSETVISELPVEELAADFSDRGADELLVLDFSKSDAEHDQAISALIRICDRAEVPVIGGGNVRRMEDVKKILYAGCKKAVLNFSKESNCELLEEVSGKFGKEKIAVFVPDVQVFQRYRERIETFACMVFCDEQQLEEIAGACALPLMVLAADDAAADLLSNPQVEAVTGAGVSSPGQDLMECKTACRKEGIPVNTFESSIPWSEFKKNSDGMVPVIVQDYQTDEVLMLAYMNEEAYETTLKTGRMTYWSRSRNELWMKGLTSGHFQYVKSLTLDCDKDTILAKVSQVGAACHTGNRSCFFQELVKKEYEERNPLKVFQQVYDVICDRKVHPKEGSYTNYLFDKGIDKILKKVGEECTEIVIAAKNPDPEEIKYEISDFLYHVMVLMAEKGVTWEEITRELARR
ncbi:MAG: bifunctional phosphoribosyl-AMP cyclohydrolase/phosphoribosyl-ATP diphosphatase HisIE [Lacrimispora saccharolytica]